MLDARKLRVGLSNQSLERCEKVPAVDLILEREVRKLGCMIGIFWRTWASWLRMAFSDHR